MSERKSLVSSELAMESPKKNFELKVILILLLVFILVLITGIVTYNRFSNIVNGITAASRPDLRLVKARTLENDLTQLGNLVKTYTLTKDDAYLDRFVKTASLVEEQLNSLEKMNAGAEDKINIKELDSLISEKFFVLNELLYSQNQFRVQEALTKVIKNIEKTTTESSNERKIVAEETVDEKPKRKLLGWIKRKKENKKDGTEEEIIAPDVALIEVEDVNREIQTIRSEELNIENYLKDSELNLITIDNSLSLKISQFLDDFEALEQEKIKKAVQDAEYEANKTNTQIAIFCISVGLLLVFMAYLIINYVRKNNEYKIALKRSQLEAQKLAKTRERFLANMSHEIRTPLNGLIGMTGLLAETKLDPQQLQYLDTIRLSEEALLHHGRACDLIVMGQDGTPASSKTESGQLVDRVVLEAGRPVLVVPSAGRFEGPPEDVAVIRVPVSARMPGSRAASTWVSTAPPACRDSSRSRVMTSSEAKGSRVCHSTPRSRATMNSPRDTSGWRNPLTVLRCSKQPLSTGASARRRRTCSSSEGAAPAGALAAGAAPRAMPPSPARPRPSIEPLSRVRRFMPTPPGGPTAPAGRRSTSRGWPRRSPPGWCSRW